MMNYPYIFTCPPSMACRRIINLKLIHIPKVNFSREVTTLPQNVKILPAFSTAIYKRFWSYCDK